MKWRAVGFLAVMIVFAVFFAVGLAARWYAETHRHIVTGNPPPPDSYELLVGQSPNQVALFIPSALRDLGEIRKHGSETCASTSLHVLAAALDTRPTSGAVAREYSQFAIAWEFRKRGPNGYESKGGPAFPSHRGEVGWTAVRMPPDTQEAIYEGCIEGLAG